MSFLTLNGVTLPVAADSLKEDRVEIGERGRAFDGTPFASIRAVKRVWSFRTPPVTQAEATAWKALLGAQGANWDMEADAYSLQGHTPTLGGSAAPSATYAKFGTKSLKIPFATSGTAAWSVGAAAQWSVAWWWYANAVWQHVVRLDDGTTFFDGVKLGFSPAMSWLTLSSGTLAFARDNTIYNADYYIDDLLFLPARVADSWPAQMAAANYQKPSFPRLLANGDMIPGGALVVPSVAGSSTVYGGGAYLEELEVELQEV